MTTGTRTTGPEVPEAIRVIFKQVTHPTNPVRQGLHLGAVPRESETDRGQQRRELRWRDPDCP